MVSETIGKDEQGEKGMTAKQNWTAEKQNEIDELERVVERFKLHVTAQIITDLKGPTKEIIAQDIADIVAGVTSEDDRLVVAMWEAQQ